MMSLFCLSTLARRSAVPPTSSLPLARSLARSAAGCRRASGHIRNKSWLRYTRLEGGKQIGLIPRAPGSLNTSFPNGGNSGDNVAFDFIEPHGRTTTSFLRAFPTPPLRYTHSPARPFALHVLHRHLLLLLLLLLVVASSPFGCSPRKPCFIAARTAANIHIIK